MSLRKEIQERRLVRYLGVYIAGGWVVLQVVDQLIQNEIVAPVAYPLTLALMGLGLPAAAVFAWLHGAPGHQTMRRWELLIIGSLGVAAVTVTGIVWSRSAAERAARGSPQSAASNPAEDLNRIAVLYFEEQPSGGELSHIASGLTVSLIEELRGVAGLTVISSGGVEPFRGQNVSPDSISRALETGTILRGTVRSGGDQLFVGLQLIDGASGNLVVSTELESPRGEVIALQDTLAQEAARFLRERIGQEIALRRVRAGTDSDEAWELLQRADEVAVGAGPLIAMGDLEASQAEYGRADALLAEASDIDDEWGEPWLRRGTLAYQMSRWSGTADRERTRTLVAQAMGYVEQALTANPDDSDGLELRGNLRYWSWLLNLNPARADQLFEDAEADLRAAARNPLQAGAFATLGHLVTNKPNSSAEALLFAQRAFEADAYLSNAPTILFRLFLATYDIGNEIDAQRWCDEGYRRYADDWRFTDCRLWLLTMQQNEADLDRALELLGEFERYAPAGNVALNGRARMAVSAVAARAGLADSAIAIAERGRAGREHDPTRDLSYMEAFTRVLLGQPDDAIRLLAEYLAENADERASTADHWWFEDLRDNPSFQTLVAIN